MRAHTSIILSFYLTLLVTLAGGRGVKLGGQYVRPEQRDLMRQRYVRIERRRRFYAQCSALRQQRRHGVFLRFRYPATEVPRPAVLVMGRRALALLAAAARPLRRIGCGEKLRERRTRRRRNRYRILRHSSRLRARLSSS